MGDKIYYIRHPEWGRFCGEFLGGGFWEFPDANPKLEPIAYSTKENAERDLKALIEANSVHRSCQVEENRTSKDQNVN